MLDNENLCALLAQITTREGTVPAIFYAKAPDDVAFKGSNYPQIILTAEKFSNPIHGVSGIMTAEIICSQDTSPPEPIERLIRESLEGVFFRGEEIFLLKWQKSSVFEEPASERTPLIIGAEITFEIYEFPQIELPEVDPLMALRDWAQLWEKNLFVIGASELEDYFVPTHEKPAVWFSLKEIKMARQMTAMVFQTAMIKVHLFAPSVQSRVEWLSAINHTMYFVKAIRLRDDSAMRLQDSTFDFTADEIAGQLTLEFEYGILKRRDRTFGIKPQLSFADLEKRTCPHSAAGERRREGERNP